MTKILGPLPCIGCGKRVFWDRIGAQLSLMERVGRTAKRHACKYRVGTKAA